MGMNGNHFDKAAGSKSEGHVPAIIEPPSYSKKVDTYFSTKSELERQKDELVKKSGDKTIPDAMKKIYDRLLTKINSELIQLDIDNEIGDAPRKTGTFG